MAELAHEVYGPRRCFLPKELVDEMVLKRDRWYGLATMALSDLMPEYRNTRWERSRDPVRDALGQWRPSV